MKPEETHLIWNIPRKKPGPKIKAFDPIIAEFIYEQMLYGKSLDVACAMPGVPSRWTIRRWRKDHPEFNNSLMWARQGRADLYFDTVLDYVYSGMAFYCGKGSLLAKVKWRARVRPDYGTFGHSTKGRYTRKHGSFRAREITGAAQGNTDAPTAAPIELIFKPEGED